MAEKTSYIRIDRNIVHWKWWFDHNTLVVFLYLLIEANIKDNGFSGQTIRRGQLVTSLPSLCRSTGLTIQQVRTAIKHLKSTGEITSKVFNKFQVITIVNYDKYQDITGKKPYKQQSTNSQATDKQHHLEKGEKGEKGEKEKGRSAPPPSPVGRNGVPKLRDEGTVDDIPEMYRDMFDSYQAYFDFRS